MSFSFKFVDKQCLEPFLPKLFQILHSNMSVIAPTGNRYEDDFEIWITNIVPAMQKQTRQIALMYVNNELAGFFQYNINSESLMIEQMQIRKEFRGTGLFSAFYTWLIGQLPKDIQTVEAYSNKKNYKSQGILEHLGLIKAGENKNGISFYYKGDYKFILNKYN